jgi:hypothetical protein
MNGAGSANDGYRSVWIGQYLDRGADAVPAVLMFGGLVKAELVVGPQWIEKCNAGGTPHILRHRCWMTEGEKFVLQPPGRALVSHMVCGQFRCLIKGDLPQITEAEILTETTL